MKVTYLSHSGFLVETSHASYLFDYIKGNLPELSAEKPFYVFASHVHGDHFSPQIFDAPIRNCVNKYILSAEIRDEVAEKDKDAGDICWMDEHETLDLDSMNLGTVKVETLHSTDIGVAFLVTEADNTRIYHAGDLNWWHWEGEEDPWNPDMEKAYKKEISILKDIIQRDVTHTVSDNLLQEDLTDESWVDLAFVPLDPRLEQAYWYGLGYYLQEIPTKHVFPMHFWGDYDIIPEYIREHPIKDAEHTIIHIIRQEEQSYEI